MSAHLDNILRRYLVRSGFPDQRAQLAERLAGEGMTPADLELLCEVNAAAAENDVEAAKIIGYRLRTAEQWKEFVKDVRYARAQKKPLVEQNPERNQPRPVEVDNSREQQAAGMGLTMEEFHRWEEQRRMVAMVRGDGKSVEMVATEFGVDTEYVHVALEAHADYLAPAPVRRRRKPPEDVPEGYEERKAAWNALRKSRGLGPMEEAR